MAQVKAVVVNRRTRRLAVLLVGILALAAVPAQGKVRTGPAGSAFYTPPRPLPGRVHGDLIWQRRAPGPVALSAAARSDLVLYRSTSAITGRPIAVSGVVSIPRGRAPRGGWPVITYAHGTTGIADQCAPSVNGPFGARNKLTTYIYPLLNRWLRAGWAVVRTDYDGLGTPGVHPFLNGRDEGRSVLDIVQAAHQLDRQLNLRKVIIAGHSQGGQAALWAASIAPSYTRGLRIRGTVAYAPASELREQAQLVPSLHSPGGGLSAFVAMILRSLAVSRSDLPVTSLLSDRARALFPQTLTTCLGGLSASSSFGGMAPADIFRQGADQSALQNAVGAWGPENLSIPGRVRVDQGTADTTVFKVFTDQMVNALRGRHVRIDYQTYKNVTHGGVVTAAAVPSTNWIRARLR